MKRFFLWALISLIAAFTGGPALAGWLTAAQLSPIGVAELEAVTGGVCFVKCDDEDDDDDEEEEPRLIGKDWRTIAQSDGPSEQLSYSVYSEASNLYGTEPLAYSVNVNDQCRFRWVSGGVGIAKGFNIQVGRSYSCDVSWTLRGEIRPGYRLKVYKGEMRQYSTVTVAEYLFFSDGSSRESGARDVGRRERRWSRFTPVQAYGN